MAESRRNNGKKLPTLTSMTLSDYIAVIIKRQRGVFNMSQREIAERAGLTQAAVAKLEAGAANPTLVTVEKLLAGLGLEGRLEVRPKR